MGTRATRLCLAMMVGIGIGCSGQLTSSQLADTVQDLPELERQLQSHPERCGEYRRLCELAAGLCAGIEGQSQRATCADITARCETQLKKHCTAGADAGAADSARCGDGRCEGSESCASCAMDCGSCAGDGAAAADGSRGDAVAASADSGALSRDAASIDQPLVATDSAQPAADSAASAPDHAVALPDAGAPAAADTGAQPPLANRGLRAFPGAEGFGADTPGGRGGKVIEVTNLNDSGPGSLREALAASGPRTVVFRVAGTIVIKSKISVTRPYLTIAGQSAPGYGITITNDPSSGKMPLVINTHDVIVRYLRIRPGASPNDDGNLDAMNLGDAEKVIVDHCSFSWSTDETFTGGGARNYTLQWNIISEGLHQASHPKGAHSKGLHLREANTDKISVHHNLLAHNYDRNPNINTDGTVDFVNNVVYNATRWTEVKDKFGEPRVNVINNFYKLGPSSSGKASSMWEVFYYNNNSLHPEVYVKGNIGFHRKDDSQAESLSVRPDSQWMMVDTRFAAPPVTTYPAFNKSGSDAYALVLGHAGATLPKRDPIDARVVEEVRTGGGKLINDPKDVGGWKVLEQMQAAGGAAPADNDHDGMADAWETQHFGGLTRSGREDADGDGYTDLEEYLNGTDPLRKD